MGVISGNMALKGVQALRSVAGIYNKIRYIFSNIRVSLGKAIFMMKTDLDITVMNIAFELYAGIMGNIRELKLSGFD